MSIMTTTGSTPAKVYPLAEACSQPMTYMKWRPFTTRGRRVNAKGRVYFMCRSFTFPHLRSKTKLYKMLHVGPFGPLPS